MIANIPTPQFHVDSPKTAAVMSPETHVLITNGSAGTKEKNRRERVDVRSATMTSAAVQQRARELSAML